MDVGDEGNALTEWMALVSRTASCICGRTTSFRYSFQENWDVVGSSYPAYASVHEGKQMSESTKYERTGLRGASPFSCPRTQTTFRFPLPYRPRRRLAQVLRSCTPPPSISTPEGRADTYSKTQQVNGGRGYGTGPWRGASFQGMRRS